MNLLKVEELQLRKRALILSKKSSNTIKLPIVVVYVICFIISRRTKLKTKYTY